MSEFDAGWNAMATLMHAAGRGDTSRAPLEPLVTDLNRAMEMLGRAGVPTHAIATFVASWAEATHPALTGKERS